MLISKLEKKFNKIEKKFNATPELCVLRKEYWLKRAAATQTRIDALRRV